MGKFLMTRPDSTLSTRKKIYKRWNSQKNLVLDQEFELDEAEPHYKKV